ncbi:MAG: hypothetical protein ACTHK7_05755 [Aureliella sp.]
MRLTLRTLLAYRDHVLKPAELEDMHARIQQSAMAANLLKRIESLIHRPTILAPPIEGKGLGADANSIAEYLDDALKREKVPELERICLESDVQLAELAQCHQLLSTALSATVEIPPALRQRIISFGNPAERAQALAERPTGLVVEGAAAAAPRPEGAAGEAPSRFRTEPQPAGTHRAGEKATAGSAGAAAAGASSNLPAAGDGKAARIVKAQPVEAPMVASGGESIRPTGLDLEGSHLAHEVPEYLRGSTHDRWRGPLAIGALVAVLALLVWQSLGSWDTVREMFAARPTASADGEASSNRSSAAESTAGETAGAAGAAGDARQRQETRPAATTSAQPTEATRAEARSEQSVASPPTANSATENAAAEKSATENTAAGTGARSAAAASAAQSSGPHAAEWLPSDPEAMRAVILAYAGEAMPLHRMQPAERLPSGTQVIVPPANRPTLDLAGGPRWTVCGPTQMAISLPETGAQPVSRVDLRLGRALIIAGSQGQSVDINTPDSQVTLTLSDPASRVAVEVSYAPVQLGPVTDRKSNPPLLQLYAVDGGASVSPRGPGGQSGATVTLQAGQMTSLRGGSASPAQAQDAPGWIDPASDRPVDVLAAEDLQRQLTSNQPVGKTLQTLVTNRRPETRSIAAQSLAMLGSWDWVGVEKNPLSDIRDRSYWGPLLDLTRQIIAANPDDAKQLRKALLAHDPQHGALQADMWLGMTQAQLQSEGLKAMVELLDSDVLLDRILAIYQLQRLTGKDFGYQAGEVNRASVQQWKRELASGQLQIAPPGEVGR